MVYILLILFISTFSYASIDDLLEQASYTSQKEELESKFYIAFKAYNEYLYNVSENECLYYLKNTSIKNKKRKYIWELLAHIYYRNKNKQGMKYILKNIYKEKDIIPEQIQKKIFVLGYNLFLDDIKYRKFLKSKFSYLLSKNKKHLKLPKKLRKFTPFVNIFPYENSRVFGFNKIYFSKKNQTFYEIGYITDTGYDELREANPLINPFDVREGMAILIPRKRIIPSIKPKINSLYINLTEKRLYYLLEEEEQKYIITFPIGIGTDNNKSPVGIFRITEKRENPDWYVPKNIREENPELPKIVPAGPDNPLGTRAMRLDTSSFLIHGTSKNFGVGLKVSHGCIRLFNRDIERLFELIPEGTKVYVYEKPVKRTFIKNTYYIELHSRKNELHNIKTKLKIQKYIFDYFKRERRGYAFPVEDIKTNLLP